MRENGYRTAKFGKTHFNGGPKVFPTLHGFDEYLGFVNHTWDYIRLSEKDEAAYRDRPSFKSFGKCQNVGPMLKAVGAGTTQDQATKASYENGFTTRVFLMKQSTTSRENLINHSIFTLPTMPCICRPMWWKNHGPRR